MSQLATRRLVGALRQDARLQFRYGFYAAGAFVTAFWIALLSFFPADALRVAVPAFLFLNGTVTTFFFVAGLVLYEKREGVLEALVITPLRHSEYLGSKVATLSLLAAVEGLAIVLIGWGSDLRILPVVAGTLGIGVLYTLFGLLFVFRYDSINEFLLPAGLFSALLQLPVIGSIGFWDSPLFYLWPTRGPLLLLQAGFEPIGPGATIYALLYTGLWVAAAVWMARSSLARFVVRSEGVR